jgi:methylase of polypeptide subunit release factors
VQALHLAGHATEVVATDVNPRALALAAATARLNGQHWDLRAGSMYDPVAGEDFDLIVCNPPFVIGAGELRYSYRDSGLAGDGICQALIEGVRSHLRPGGTAQLLANWIVREDTDWRERVGAWVQSTGCDAWVVQRELADPAEYVGLWLTDAGEDGKSAGSNAAAAASLAENWLDYLAAERVQGIGMGLITLQRNDSAHPSVTLDQITGPDEDVTGEEAAGFLRRRGWVERAADADLLATRFVLSPQVVLEQRSLAGHEGWTTVLRMIRRQGGPGATLQLDEWGQALLAGCRGDAPLQLLIELLAAAHGLSAGALAAAVLPSVRVAVIRGLLEPAAA